jgi:Tfp pilus assembly protein PilN
VIGLRERAGTDAPVVVTSSVNLLSPWVHEEHRVRRWRRRFGIGLLALVVAIAGFWAFQRIVLAQVEADLRGEEATARSLQGRIAELAPVQAYVDGVDRRARAVQQQMATDVAFSVVLEALGDATPAGARIESLSVDLPTGVASVVAPDGTIEDPTRGLVAAGCPGPDPFAVLEVIGCVTLSGTAADRASVGRLVEELAASKEFSEPFITTTTTDQGASVTFAGSVALTPRVFSGRYDDRSALTGLSDEEPAR